MTRARHSNQGSKNNIVLVVGKDQLLLEQISCCLAREPSNRYRYRCYWQIRQFRALKLSNFEKFKGDASQIHLKIQSCKYGGFITTRIICINESHVNYENGSCQQCHGLFISFGYYYKNILLFTEVLDDHCWIVY